MHRAKKDVIGDKKKDDKEKAPEVVEEPGDANQEREADGDKGAITRDIIDTLASKGVSTGYLPDQLYAFQISKQVI